MARGDEPTRVVSPALVGRADELDRITSAATAPPALVVVDGEAGIGKTRLVTELATRPELADRLILTGRCHRIRESFPLGPVIESLRGLGPRLDDTSLSPVAGALQPLLPELAGSLPPAPTPLDDRIAERHRVFRALVAVLDALGPTVLVLEDLHWADDQTVDWLAYALSEAPSELAVVVTYRGDEIDPWVRALPARLPGLLARADVTLRPLDVRETGELAAAIVGAERSSHEFAAYLHERSSGLPFAVEELLALLRATGKLVRRDDGWARRALDELDVPSGIRDPALERVSRLSPAARSTIEAAAVLQVATPADVLQATAAVDADQAAAALDEALESGLLAEQTGTAIGFRHLLAAQAVYDEIPTTGRPDLHGRAADALAAGRPVPLGQVAHHLRHAGRIAEWVDAAERAADQALALGDDAAAFRLLEAVLRQAPLDPERRGRLAVRLGQAAIEALRVHDVVTLLDDVLAQELPPAIRAELRFQVGMLLHDIGDDPDRVRELLIESVAELDDRPDLRAWAMVVLGIPTAEGVSLDEHRTWLRRALDVVPAIDDREFEVFLLGKVAMVMAPFGDREWRTLADRIEQHTAGSPRRRREVNAYLSVGTEACYAGHHDTAQRLLAAALDGAVAGENRRLQLAIRAARTLLDFCRGAWNQLADEVDMLVDELAQHPRAGIDADIVAGWLALVRGDLVDADRRLPPTVEQCFELGAYDVLPIAASALIRLDLARGRDATASARRLVDTIEAKGIWATDARALPALVEALVRGDEVATAHAVVDRCDHAFAALDAPLADAAVRHARGLLHGAAGDRQRAADELHAAAQAYRKQQAPYEAAVAEEHVAVAQLGAGDPASESLLAALASYRELDATWDARRVAQVAREHDISVPTLHRGGRRSFGDDLSPREHEVADLAAAGRTNKEIASELFLSTHTVARHMSSAMRKLGVRSRTALARQLDDQPPNGPADQD